jgi:hypothetical protein
MKIWIRETFSREIICVCYVEASKLKVFTGINHAFHVFIIVFHLASRLVGTGYGISPL